MSLSFFAPVEDREADAAPQQGGYARTRGPACRTAPQLPEDTDLDRLIRAAGEQMVAWYDHDRAVALFWLRRMDALIAQRTAQHRAAIEQRIQHRIEDPCYFSSDAAHSLSGGLR